MGLNLQQGRIFGRVALVAGVLTTFLLFLMMGLYSHYRFSQARYEGHIKVQGLARQVTILRDGHAIPHIFAGSHREALFGLGYAVAQDRLWQMEFLRRVMRGRLAEILGADALPTDIYMRQLGLYRFAGQGERRLTPQTLALLQSYADGVNAFLKTRRGALPVEFALAGTGFSPWRVADSLAVLKYMELSLSGNLSVELLRANLASKLTREQIEELLPPAAGDPANPLPGWLSLYAKKKAAARELPKTTASNNWVVAGFRSMTGAPLLASDPHLQLTIPSIWYLAHMSFPGGDIIGAALPGGPGMTLGHNGNVAWGMTNTGPDTQDLYLERVDPKDANYYLTPTGRSRFTTREEKIVVRFGATKTIIVRGTRHGPVISDNDKDVEAILPKGHVIAAQWTALTADDHTIDWMLKANRAKDTKAFLAAMPDYLAPMQNIVHASRDSIGLYLPGKVPLRAAENDSLGLVPGKGWDARYDWTGYIPANRMPRIDNPRSGQIATANNKTVPPGYPYTLTREWEEPYRFARADKLLKQRAKHTLESFRAIQLDTYDGYAAALLPLLVNAKRWDGEQAEIVKALTAWNRHMDADKPEPLIYAAWNRALIKRVLGDELGKDFRKFWTQNPTFMLNVLSAKAFRFGFVTSPEPLKASKGDRIADLYALMKKQRLSESRTAWCNDVTTKSKETCSQQIALALSDALTELKDEHGGDWKDWRWGDAHQAVMGHLPFGNVPLLGSIFSREIEASGGAFTLRRGDYKMNGARPFVASHGSGFRALIDLSDPDASLYMIATGQSGNVFSKHYDDLMPLWAKGEYVHIPQSRDAVETIAEYRLLLQPAKAP